MGSACSTKDPAEKEVEAINSLPMPVGNSADQEFCVSVQKDPELGLGLSLEQLDGELLYVCAILDGPVNAYNQSISQFRPTAELRVGDYIFGVNGLLRRGAKMLQHIKSCGTDVNLYVARPLEFKVVLGAGASELGMDITHAPMGRSIFVQNVKGGKVAAWNKANPEFEVVKNDRIIEINGVRASQSEGVVPLLEELTNNRQGRITMIVSRPQNAVNALRVGDTCEIVQKVNVRSKEDVSSPVIDHLQPGALATVLEVSGRRVKVTSYGVTGWISTVGSGLEILALKVRPTSDNVADFRLGDQVETLDALKVRGTEDTSSEILVRNLPRGTLLEVIGIGKGPRRIKVRNNLCEGWISTADPATGAELVMKVSLVGVGTESLPTTQTLEGA